MFHVANRNCARRGSSATSPLQGAAVHAGTIPTSSRTTPAVERVCTEKITSDLEIYHVRGWRRRWESNPCIGLCRLTTDRASCLLRGYELRAETAAEGRARRGSTDRQVDRAQKTGTGPLTPTALTARIYRFETFVKPPFPMDWSSSRTGHRYPWGVGERGATFHPGRPSM